MVVLCVGSKGQVFATSAIRYTWATSFLGCGVRATGQGAGAGAGWGRVCAELGYWV